MEVKINNKKFNVNPSEERYISFWNDVNNNIWEPSSFNLMDRYLNEDSVVIDIGSWIGPISLYASTIAKKVYSVEPDNTAYREFTKNIEANPELSKKITTHKMCINNVNKKVLLWNNDCWGNSGSRIVEKDKNTSTTSEEVESITLYDFLLNNKIEKFDYLKVDIEGAEANVIPDISNLLTSYKPVLLLSIHSPYFNNFNSDMQKIINVLKLAKQTYYIKFNSSEVNLIDPVLLADKKDEFFDVLCIF